MTRALVVVDVQNDVVANAHQRDEVISNIKTLVEKARTQHVPVIWVQHADENMVERTAAALAEGGALRSAPAASVAASHD